MSTSSPAHTDTNAVELNGSAEIAQPLSKLAFSIREFCNAVGIGRSLAYSEINAGRLTAVRCGRRSLIRAVDAQRWLANLPEGVAGEPAAPRQARLARQRLTDPPTADGNDRTPSGHLASIGLDVRSLSGIRARSNRQRPACARGAIEVSSS
jgi:excisionase family DNA binding protein